LTITLDPVAVSIGVTELPSLRVHLPAHFSCSFSVLDRQLFSARLYGEAQVITEPYGPNPCERCGSEGDEVGRR
jgi:hypothetical protein